MTVADLLRGLLLASANDAAATLAARVGGSQTRLRRAHEPPRAPARADPHPLRQRRSASTTPGNYSSAEDLVKLTLILRRNAFFRAVTDLPRATLRTRRRTRGRSSTATCSCARCPRSTASRPATPPRAGYILVGSATKNGRHGHLGRARRAQRGGARRRLAGAPPLRPGPLPPRRAPVREGAGVRHRQARPSRRARAARGGRAPSCAPPGAASSLPIRVLDVPRELDGPLPAGARVGTIQVRWRGRTVARVPLVTRRGDLGGLRSGSAAATC